MTPALLLEEAQARLLGLAPLMPVQHVAVEDAAGLYLADRLTARRAQPAADLSAMDGYALASGDTTGPWQIVGESAAGHPFAGTVQPGQAVRISTGAVMPQGAGTVLIQENATRKGDHLKLSGNAPTSAYVRHAGFDFHINDALLEPGQAIGPAQIALALAAGHTHLPVRRAPTLAIIDSGDELARPGSQLAPHQIPASNGAMLAAQVRAEAGTITRFGPVADTMLALVEALDAAGGAEVIVTSGGASVGDHDLVRPALERWGAQIAFWRVAIRPGKPLLIARRAGQMVIGLPGNPVSGLVTAHLFLRPLLRAMMGAARPLPMAVQAQLARPLGQGGERREFQRGAWDGACVVPQPMRDSSALAAMAHSNCLIDRPARDTPRNSGEMVRIYPLD